MTPLSEWFSLPPAKRRDHERRAIERRAATIESEAAATEVAWLFTVPPDERPPRPPKEKRIGDVTIVRDAGGPDSPNYRKIRWDRRDAASDETVETGALGKLVDVTKRDTTRSTKPAKLPARVGFDERVWTDDSGDELAVELFIGADPTDPKRCPSNVPWVAGVMAAISAAKLTQLERDRQRNTVLGPYPFTADEMPNSLHGWVREVVAAYRAQLPPWADSPALLMWLFRVCGWDEGGGPSGQLTFRRLSDELEDPARLAKTIRAQGRRRGDRTHREPVGEAGEAAARVYAAYCQLADSIDPEAKRRRSLQWYLATPTAKAYLPDGGREPRTRRQWIYEIFVEAHGRGRGHAGHVRARPRPDDLRISWAERAGQVPRFWSGGERWRGPLDAITADGCVRNSPRKIVRGELVQPPPSFARLQACIFSKSSSREAASAPAASPETPVLAYQYSRGEESFPGADSAAFSFHERLEVSNG